MWYIITVDREHIDHQFMKLWLFLNFQNYQVNINRNIKYLQLAQSLFLHLTDAITLAVLASLPLVDVSVRLLLRLIVSSSAREAEAWRKIISWGWVMTTESDFGLWLNYSCSSPIKYDIQFLWRISLSF